MELFWTVGFIPFDCELVLVECCCGFWFIDTDLGGLHLGYRFLMLGCCGLAVFVVSWCWGSGLVGLMLLGFWGFAWELAIFECVEG